MIQIVILATDASGSIAGIILARKLLQIIIPSVRAARPLGPRHRNVLARHLLKERIILAGSAGPEHNSIFKQALDGIGIPHVGNVGVIFTGNGVRGFAAAIAMRMRFFATNLISRRGTAGSTIAAARPFGIALAIIISNTPRIPPRIVAIISMRVFFLLAHSIY